MHPRSGIRWFRRARSAQAPNRQAPDAVVYIVVALIAILCASPGIYFLATQLKDPVSRGHSEPTPTVDTYSNPLVKLQQVGAFDLKMLDPPNATDTSSSDLVSMVFPSLVTLDKNSNIIPWAAEAAPTVSIDGLSYTFQIRSGLKWSDGTAITAQTFAYSLDRAENPCNAFGTAHILYMIKDAATFNHEPCDEGTGSGDMPLNTLIGDSITTPDPLTLVVRLAAPAVYFVSAMTTPAAYAVPQQLIARYGASYVEHLTDHGPFGGDLFDISHLTRYGQVTLLRNDAFWGTQPKISTVDITFYKSASSAYDAFRAGQDDVGPAPPTQFASEGKHLGFQQIPAPQIDYYAMNWTMAPFNDIRMRQAFDIALDKNVLATDTRRGEALPTDHIVPVGMPGYNYRALLAPANTEGLSGDTQRANSLATAYATDTGCGTATDFSKCPPVALSIRSDSPDAASEATAARQMWLAALPQYPITITVMDASTLQRKAMAHQLQFWASSALADYPDPHEWLTANLACGVSGNAGQVCDERANSLLLSADITSEQSARMDMYQDAEQILVTDVAWLPLDQTTSWWEAKPWIQNFSIASDGLIPKETWQTLRNTRRTSNPVDRIP